MRPAISSRPPNKNGTNTLTFDAVNRVATSVDLWGKRLTFTYDNNGNRTQVLDSAGGPDRFDLRRAQPADQSFLHRERLHPDANRRVLRRRRPTHRTRPLRPGFPRRWIAYTSYTYDADGRLTKPEGQERRPHHPGELPRTRTTPRAGCSRTRPTARLSHTPTTTATSSRPTAPRRSRYDANGNRNNGSYTPGTGKPPDQRRHLDVHV